MKKSRSGSLFCSLRNEWRIVNKPFVLLISALLLIIGIFTRWVCGNPIFLIHTLNISDLTPPVWLMIVMFSLSYIASGIALGCALGAKSCRNDKKYQGAMWFSIMASLGYAWYPILFCANLLFISLLITVICFACAIFATVCFAQISRISLLTMILYDVWLLYLLMLNLQIFFMT